MGFSFTLPLEEITLEEFLKEMRREDTKTHADRLPDGRLKVCCYLKIDESFFCRYFYPRYFSIEKKRGGGRNKELDEKVVYRAIIANMRPSDIKVKFGIDASVTHRIEAKVKKLGW